MMKLMQILVLSCWQATYYSSIKSFKKISVVRRMQLWMHLHMCKDCHEFDHQSELIDNSISHLQNNSLSILNSEHSLSEEKILQLKSTVNQHLK